MAEKEKLLDILKKMLKMRRFELGIVDLNARGMVPYDPPVTTATLTSNPNPSSHYARLREDAHRILPPLGLGREGQTYSFDSRRAGVSKSIVPQGETAFRSLSV